jgi:integrase
MSLYKRGKVYWSYIWINNVRHGKSLKTKSKQEAIRREIEFRNELDLSRQKKSNFEPEMSFSELATRFLGSSLVTPYHVDRLEQLLPYFGDTPLNEISKPLADEYRRHRKRVAKITDSTVNHDISVLRRVLFYALDNGILLTNPLSRIRMTGIRRIRQPVLSLEEEPALLAVAAPHLKPLIIAALDTGMRRGELFAQRAEDIDLYRKVLSVTHSKTAGGEQREIPLTARMVELLKSMPKSGLVFTYEGHKIDKLRRSWVTAIKNARIRPLNFKHLRHTFNTRLMEAGVIQDVRMSLMGHSRGRPRTTNDIYTHVELPMLRQAIQKLEQWTLEQKAEIEELKEEERLQDQQTTSVQSKRVTFPSGLF